MKLSVLSISLLTLSALLTSCQTYISPTPHRNRTAEVKQRYQQQSAKDLQKEADELYEAAIRYYHAGHYQKALEFFIQSQRIFERIEHLGPKVSARLKTIKDYLIRLNRSHGHTVLRFAERQLEHGQQFLSLEMLEVAEQLLEKLKSWDPNLRNEADALLRRIKQAKVRTIRKKRDLT